MDTINSAEAPQQQDAFYPIQLAIWERLNLSAELGGGPYMTPLNLPQQAESLPVNYTAVTPGEQLQRMDISTAELQGKLVANLGSGKQPLGAFLREHGANCLDVDASRFMADYLINPKSKVVMDAEMLGVADDSLDVVLASHILNIAENPSAVIAEAVRVLKPGGKLIVFPVMSTMDVEGLVMPGVELRRVGLDYFTLIATKSENGDLAEQMHFYNSGPFRYSLMTSSPQEIRQYYNDRINGFYYNDFYDRYLSKN